MPRTVSRHSNEQPTSSKFRIFLLEALNLSKEEIKLEINKVLDHLSDKTLQDILSLLKNIESKQTFSHVERSALGKIISEDKELLEKFAK